MLRSVDLRSPRIAATGTGLLWVVCVGALVFAPELGVGPVGMRQIMLIALLSLVVSGLNLSRGYAGELALGQAAIYAAGAYMAGYAAIHWQNDLVVNLLLAVGIALVIGIVTGVPGLRLGGWMLAVASFYMVLLIPNVVRLFDQSLGGLNGLSGIPRAEAFGTVLDNLGFYRAVILVAGLWFVVFRNLIRSAHGRAFLVLRQSPVLAQSLGISSYQMKLKAYAIGAVPAGLAGGLFAYLDGFIVPENFGFHYAVLVLAASVLGGAESVLGAILGSALLITADRQFHDLRDYSLVMWGSLLVLGGIFLPSGLAGGFQSVGAWIRRRRHVQEDASLAGMRREMPTMNGGELVVSQVVKRFGGVTALGGVDLVANPGQITALIGPNGSGKTTLLNVISGFYNPDGGEVRLDGDVLSGNKPYVVARRGVARTFQTPSVPSTMTVGEVVETGRYSRHRSSMGGAVLRSPKARRMARENKAAALDVLASLGIAHLRSEVASHLSLGTRRLIELGRAIVADPSVLLLDEVASGLDEQELLELAAIIRAVRDAGSTVVLVEHNFSLVRELADHIFVLADGLLIADGSPDEIARHPEVLQRYLGEPVHTAVGPEQELEATR